MSETEAPERGKARIEQLEIDLSNVPLRPTSKKEIQQLEMALIIGTLYRPEVIELIRDPMERATWVDSLAVAAAALARYKAGYSIREIAEELGRSETMIRAHLHGKTKAGKLVLETYEKLAKGELKLVVPFAGVHLTAEEYEELKAARERLRELHEKIKELEARIEALEEENKRLKKQLEECMPPEEVQKRISEVQSMIEELEKENEELRRRLRECEEGGGAAAEKVKKLEEELEKVKKELEERNRVLEEARRLLCGQA
ncbi:hypothetical protein Pyrfu_1413 [Pyrolobus fumarii 1A]|uniref:Uncharacterized protein n=1 Tax=Pyrolobus fumarii (strain DSM 11204 / 1A) TaxID=694429 RepID=G0EH47_PYRF1|nr:transcriptional regulator [Pyrolobus fumarii]AEM39271.1 hypothetical protein Pyrfu_1413 [Pyrolobus fumarii 1A]